MGSVLILFMIVYVTTINAQTHTGEQCFTAYSKFETDSRVATCKQDMQNKYHFSDGIKNSYVRYPKDFEGPLAKKYVSFYSQRDYDFKIFTIPTTRYPTVIAMLSDKTEKERIDLLTNLLRAGRYSYVDMIAPMTLQVVQCVHHTNPKVKYLHVHTYEVRNPDRPLMCGKAGDTACINDEYACAMVKEGRDSESRAKRMIKLLMDERKLGQPKADPDNSKPDTTVPDTGKPDTTKPTHNNNYDDDDDDDDAPPNDGNNAAKISMVVVTMLLFFQF